MKVKAEGKEGASSEDAGRAKSPVGTELGDSFHFKNGADNTSSDILDPQQLSHGSGEAFGDGQPAEGPVRVQDADQIDISNASHHDHWHANLHAAHDLIV